MFWPSAVSLLAIHATLVAGHPGANHEHELAVRREHLQNSRSNLSHCAKSLEARGITKRSIERRAAVARSLEGEVSANVYPHQHAVDISAFASNASCALSPEEILGPYYVAGEYVREDVREHQVGVPFTLDVQFIDSSTCEPVAGKYIELWGANSTGVYGGVVAPENGNGNGDPDNLKNSWLRGVQKSDEDGVVQFRTIFPGHYIGRTNHLHVLVHPDAKPFPNGTILSTTASFVGQLYFPQELANRVEKKAPYNTNKQPVTSNDQDEFLQGDLAQGGNPIIDYKLVTNDISDGVIGWLSYGIDVEKKETVEPIHTFNAREAEETQAY